MSERTPAIDIFRMAVVGSLFGMTTTVAALLSYWIAVEPENIAMILVFGLFAGLLFGLFICCVLATPIGFVVGLLLTLHQPLDRVKGMLAGLITGLVSVATVLVFFVGPHGIDAVVISALFLFSLLGALSGLVAQRIVQRTQPRGLYP